MNKLIFLIKVSLIVGYVLCGCSPDLRNGKSYTVIDVRGRTVNFKETGGDWYVNTDTMKIGDKVKVRRTFKQDSATIW